MRKLIASTFVSLDGLVVGQNEDMSWVLDNFTEEMGKYGSNLMDSMDTIILGRVTYEIMANYWPTATMEMDAGTDKMNNTPKVVFSRTLDKVGWGKYNNARLVKDHAAEEIKKMKNQPGKNMVIYGSANLVQNFTNMGLIDEYQLLVHPIVLGKGKPLFNGMGQQVNLNLLQTQSFKNGVVVLYYQPSGGKKPTS